MTQTRRKARAFAELTSARENHTGIKDALKRSPFMEHTAQTSTSQHIDLTRAVDVAYWCRIFDVSIEQLREAVHHAGHQVAEVRHYLIAKAQPLG
jgi:hypothetical protein